MIVAKRINPVATSHFVLTRIYCLKRDPRRGFKKKEKNFFMASLRFVLYSTREEEKYDLIIWTQKGKREEEKEKNEEEEAD